MSTHPCSNINCMVNDSSVYNPTEYANFLAMPPGLRYTRDEQCQAITGETGSYFRGNIRDICTKLQCFKPSSGRLIDQEGRALDKTTCGNGMVTVYNNLAFIHYYFESF